jgi:hypothetical protein
MFFDVEKLIGFAAYVMKKMQRSSMQYIKLIKLMYLSDRESVKLYDRTISNDDLYSMDNGPILSRLLNLIRYDCNSELQTPWNTCFSVSNYDIEIHPDKAYPFIERLSRAEMKIVDNVVAEFGGRDVWDLIDNYLHHLPEWKNPHGSSIPIRLEDLMRVFDRSEEEIAAVKEENEAYREELSACGRVAS